MKFLHDIGMFTVLMASVTNFYTIQGFMYNKDGYNDHESNKCIGESEKTMVIRTICGFIVKSHIPLLEMQCR